MQPGVVRAIAICVFRRGGDIFVFEGRDEIKGETFYRPLGGTIEFSEYSAYTVTRELREEINTEIKNLRYLGTLENIFIYQGKPGHEIVMVYEAEFANIRMYDQDVRMGFEDDGAQFKALWVSLADLASGNHPLYPDGLLALLGAN